MHRLLALTFVALLLAGCSSPGSSNEGADATQNASDPDGASGRADAFDDLKETATPVGRAVLTLQGGGEKGRWEVILNRSYDRGGEQHIYYDTAAHIVILSMKQRAEPSGIMLINHTSIEFERGVAQVTHDVNQTPYGAPRKDAFEAWDPRLIVVETLMANVIYAQPQETVDDSVEDVPATRYAFPSANVWIEKAATGRMLRYELLGSQPATVQFHYGERATHPFLAQAMVLEGMAFYEKADALRVITDVQQNTNYTWTVRTTDATMALPLSDLQVRSDANLTLPLAAGTKENARLRLTFTDVDRNAKLSPGDTLRVESLQAGRNVGNFDIFVEHPVGGSIKLA